VTPFEPAISIEGPTLLGDSPSPRRIEIDPRSGLIARVDEPRGEADLLLGEEALVMPGLIDLHVHAREDASGQDVYKEDFKSAGAAAIHGGVTAFADMPNNPRPPVDGQSYAAKLELAQKAPVDVLLFAGVGPRTRPLTFPAPYKVYMGPSVGDLYFETLEELRETLSRYSGQWVAFHAEAPEILRQRRDRSTHAERRPREAEVKAVEFALELAREHGFLPHLCHLSTAGGLEAIRTARRRGLEVTCEVAPHHLYFDLEALESYPRPGFLQVNPPLRPREDRLALLEALRGGEIDCLATDHAPHSLEENERGISGMPHLDTLGPFLFWLEGQGVSWDILRRVTSANPGRVFERFLPQRFGRIEPGAAGSLTVLERGSFTVERSSLRTRAGWSPFEGVSFPGRVAFTVVRGKVHRAEADR
jgi:dihydroorotase